MEDVVWRLRVIGVQVKSFSLTRRSVRCSAFFSLRDKAASEWNIGRDQRYLRKLGDRSFEKSSTHFP